MNTGNGTPPYCHKDAGEIVNFHTFTALLDEIRSPEVFLSLLGY